MKALARPSSFLPILMSAVVIAAILWHLSRSGLAHETDEGTAAHLFQILMPLQLPVIVYFGLRWIPVDAGWAVKLLAVQLGLAAAIFAAVFFLLDR